LASLPPKLLERGYVCDFYGCYLAFLVVVDYDLAVGGGFALGAVRVVESYVEVAHVVAVVYGYHFLRQL
jgi:hypothetical protein